MLAECLPPLIVAVGALHKSSAHGHIRCLLGRHLYRVELSYNLGRTLIDDLFYGLSVSYLSVSYRLLRDRRREQAYG